jgi:hypothetical protein
VIDAEHFDHSVAQPIRDDIGGVGDDEFTRSGTRPDRPILGFSGIIVSTDSMMRKVILLAAVGLLFSI